METIRARELQAAIHLIDGAFLLYRPSDTIEAVMDPLNWEEAVVTGPGVRSSALTVGTFGFVFPADGECYHVWCREVRPDGRPVLAHIRSAPPPSASTIATQPPAPRRAA